MAQVILDHTCTYKELAIFYRDKGVDPIAFDRDGDKTLAEFHKELRHQDSIIFWHEKVERIVRFAFSVKGLLETPEGLLLETARQHGNHPRKEGIKPWTISGQHRRNEDPIRALKREFWGECKLRIEEVNLKRITGLMAPEPTLRESSVYPNTLSAVMVQRFSYARDMNLKNRVIDDGTTRVFLEVFPEIPHEVMEEYRGSIDYFTEIFGKEGFL